MQTQTRSSANPAPHSAAYNIAPSKVHGRGLIAAREIATGETIGLAVGFKARHPLLTDMARHVNHSDRPNSSLKKIAGQYHLVATCIIKAGDEIFTDYNDTPTFLILARPDFD